MHDTRRRWRPTGTIRATRSRRTSRSRRDADNKLGVVTAVNAVTGKTEWKYPTRAGMQSLLTTGGGLLFAGDAAGRFRALDQASGKVLWEMNLGSAVTGYPVTFEVGGHQYVAVSTGFWLGDNFTPELVHGTQGTLFVFALPDAGIGLQGRHARRSIPRASTIALDPATGRGASRRRSTGRVLARRRRPQARQRLCGALRSGPRRELPARRRAWRRSGARRSSPTGAGARLAGLYAKIHAMPPGQEARCPTRTTSPSPPICSKANSFPAGSALPGDEAALGEIGFEQQGSPERRRWCALDDDGLQ